MPNKTRDNILQAIHEHDPKFCAQLILKLINDPVKAKTDSEVIYWRQTLTLRDLSIIHQIATTNLLTN